MRFWGVVLVVYVVAALGYYLLLGDSTNYRQLGSAFGVVLPFAAISLVPPAIIALLGSSKWTARQKENRAIWAFLATACLLLLL